ncbi:MAG: hypothetical protein JW768_06515 [Chitinispirillaceae bacterium]|nr:hypothetical protein [Chitinispirillaceae bacterium]
MRLVYAIIMVTGCLVCLAAETNIGGNLGGMTLDSTGNPYVVDRDIVIPKGKYLAINEGCNLLFKPFTGITIKGNLKVNGTQEHPVLFTSINDTVLNPQAEQSPDAFDWNGILVARESGEVEVKFANLRYSVYGIKCQNPDILIMQSVFRQNGQFHFTINDKIQQVPEDQPFSYNLEKKKADAGTSPGKLGSTSRGGQEHSQMRTIVRYASLGVGVVGVLTGTVLAFTARDNHQQALDYDINKPGASEEEWDSLNSSYRTSAILSGVTFTLGAAGFVGFGLTFVF